MRIEVRDVLDMLANGATDDGVLRSYPYLEPEDIEAARELGSKMAGDEIREITVDPTAINDKRKTTQAP